MVAMYLLRRLLSTILVLGALSVGLFALFHLMPGRAEDQILAQNPDLTPEETARISRLMGSDRSIAERYVCWVLGPRGDLCDWWPGEGLLRGDLGHSTVHNTSVGAVLLERVPNTLRLMLPALLLALLLSLPLGVWSAVRRGARFDRAVMLLTFPFLCSPVHWVALLFILIFALSLDLLPTGGVAPIGGDGLLGVVRHAILPVSVSALFFTARWVRHLRGSMLEVLPEAYLDTARAKGLLERDVVLRHALPNALLPFITIVTQSLPALFSGTLIVERVFSYPGVGLLIFESVAGDDHLVAVVVVLIAAGVTMLSMRLAELLYRVADPRTRAAKGRAG